MTTLQWEPYREPLRTTLLRTGIIALAVGAVLAHWMGGLAHWPMATLLALWPSFGGHWVEIGFVNWLRFRLPASRSVQAGARIAVWFVAGIVLALGMLLTAIALAGFPPHWHALWRAGLAFIAVELVAHVSLHLRGQPSFYNGRG